MPHLYLAAAAMTSPLQHHLQVARVTAAVSVVVIFNQRGRTAFTSLPVIVFSPSSEH